ncbi:MAG: putative bacteriocin export ABC transporter [Streptococcaceae bacterium]|jgi:putative ABC transport system ATP-binding protein|nr:putative bacteriocin export ABC transporter [Streptococcaceae bacterium]
MVAIQIKNLEKGYNGFPIFENFCLEVPENKMVTIYGPSGAGKSTLLNIMGLIEDYDDGELYLFGEFAPEIYSRQSLITRRKVISYLFQNFALVEDESIEKNLAVALYYMKKTQHEKRILMKEMLEKVHLNHSLRTKIYSLSGGEKQRVAVARALLKESKIILADEPTGSLDKNNRDKIIKLLKEQVEEGKTVVIVTHDLEIVEKSDLAIEI